ncbi:hypothetical protein [Aeoliella sp.]|uniref:hypothetical protein n=1 Tax=Aeoliella sp. TaxID=2795800 RepID=UPI003CCB8DF8
MAEQESELATMRGVGSFEYNGSSVFVDADVEAVSAALAQHRGASAPEVDVAGREVELTKQCFFVFRFAGHRWSQVIGRESYSDAMNPFMGGSFDPEALKAELATHLNKDDAVALSKQLGTKVLYYQVSDTAGALGYTLYDNGNEIEHLEVGENYDEEGESEDMLEFSSASGESGPADEGEAYDWVDALFKRLDCFEPGVAFKHFVGYIQHKPGDKVTINDPEGQFERVDFVAE